jgi:hypothetical protein
MGSVGLPELVIVAVLALSLFVAAFPAGRICQRLGFSGWFGLLAAIPVLQILFLWFLAFSEWPAIKSTRGNA